MFTVELVWGDWCQDIFQSFHSLVSVIQGRGNDDNSVQLTGCSQWKGPAAAPQKYQYRGEPARRELSLSRTCMRWVRLEPRCSNEHQEQGSGAAGPFFTAAQRPCSTAAHHHLGSLGKPATLSRRVPMVCSQVLPYAAGRNETPCGIWPVVARRQSAMSSLRARATIMVLRAALRPSAVRAWNHCASALCFWNLKKRQAS